MYKSLREGRGYGGPKTASSIKEIFVDLKDNESQDRLTGRT